MEFKKLSAPSLKDLFVQEMETMILSGRLPIGEKLPSERELSASMQVSRSVINSGVSELALKGFLTIKPRVGIFVADYRKNGTLETLISIMNYNGGTLRKDEIRSILELRIALDTLAIKLCVQSITNSELEILQICTDNLKNSTTFKEASEWSFRFQHELAFISGNTLIPLIFSSFKAPIMVLWERFCILYGIESLYKNTADLLSCIESRDTDQAVSLLTQIIERTISGDRPIYY